MAAIRIEGTRTQTIRTVLIAAFAALTVVLLGAFGLQKLKSHGLHLDLPGRLGADISQTANGFTYSQSQRGHTIFTIHASKIVQFKHDQAELHDVSITLYGPEGSHRQDRISGSDFLYNKQSGMVTAKGRVQIDMASPAAGTPGNNAPPDTIHVQTSNLRFDQKTGEAQTDQPLTFSLPRASGTSIGGDYNSKTGVLILQDEVELHADQNGDPAVLHASHAQLLRDSHVAYLLRAQGQFGGGRESADQVVLTFRPDGTMDHLDAQDHVRMRTAEGAELYSTTATVYFDSHSEPTTARAGGGANFVLDSPDSNLHGNAVEGTVVFTPDTDGKATLSHAQFRNAVSFVIQQKFIDGDPRGSATREMTASKLDIEFGPGPDGKSLAQKATAQGGATVNLHDLPYGSPPRNSTVYGEQLVATLVNGRGLRQLDGSGGTKIIDYAPDGATDTTTGDVLHATFETVAEAEEKEGKVRHLLPTRPSVHESATVSTATQQGRVTLAVQPARYTRTSDGTPQQALYAEGESSSFNAADQTLRLIGTTAHPPRVHNNMLALTATEIDYGRNSGDAQAHGDVRSTYMQNAGVQNAGKAPSKPGVQAGNTASLGGAGAVHIVAPAALMSRNTNVILFTGTAQQPARMWQGANSVLAPVLELGRGQSSLAAHGLGNARDQVHAVFAANAASSPRVTADTLFYSDSTRAADFRGAVVLEQPNGTVHADDAQVFLTEAPQGEPSQLDRMVATGHVSLQQPGRNGTGEKLVYTAADGNYVLTGTAGVPPRAADAQKGATSGAALLFRSGDDSVEVQNHDAEGNSRRTVTDIRSPK